GAGARAARRPGGACELRRARGARVRLLPVPQRALLGHAAPAMVGGAAPGSRDRSGPARVRRGPGAALLRRLARLRDARVARTGHARDHGRDRAPGRPPARGAGVRALTHADRLPAEPRVRSPSSPSERATSNPGTRCLPFSAGPRACINSARKSPTWRAAAFLRAKFFLARVGLGGA